MRWLTATPVALAALLASPVSGEADSQAKPADAVEPVILMVTDYAGMPVEGAKFQVEWPDGKKTDVETQATGEAQVSLADKFDSVDIRLADPRFVSAPLQQDSVPGRRLLGWTLYRGDTAAMSADERGEFARVWSRVAVREPWPAEPTATEKTLKMLTGIREETIEGIPAADDPAWQGGAVVSSRTVDTLGRPVVAALGRIFALDESTGRARSLAVARTDESGVAKFAGLPPGLVCRIEFTDGDTAGRGTLVKTAAAQPQVDTVVMRRRGETVTGFVFDARGPAADTIVRANAAGGAPLAATTDAAGFFSIGPVRGQVRLTLVRGTERGTVRATWSARGGDEVAIPLHLAGQLEGT